ncbi:MAG: helicase associated domain-containing protein [Bacteroidetes bacterium]|nr:helicase associated domain-containing protein [Bacteroidota bacterium]
MDIYQITEKRWDKRLAELKEFGEKTQCKWPRYDSESSQERALYMFIFDLRKRYKKGLLEAEKLQALKDIGYHLEKKAPRRDMMNGFNTNLWLKKFDKLKKFLAENENRYPSSKSIIREEIKLCEWVAYNRAQCKKGKLPTDIIAMLDGMNFSFKRVSTKKERVKKEWHHRPQWMVKYDAIKELFSHTPKRIADVNHPLYDWQQHHKRKFNSLKTERQELLNAIDFMAIVSDNYESEKNERWLAHFNEIVAYKDKFGRLPLANRAYPHHIKWIALQRFKYCRDLLSKEKEEILRAIGIKLTKNTNRNSEWERKYNAYKKFIEEKKRLPTRKKADAAEKELHFFRQMQHMSIMGKMKAPTPERLEKLKAVGIYPIKKYKGESPRNEVVEAKWQKQKDEVLKFMAANGNKLPRVKSNNRQEQLLRNWLHFLIARHKKGSLNKNWASWLIEIGFLKIDVGER